MAMSQHRQVGTSILSFFFFSPPTNAICLKQRPGLFHTDFRKVTLGTERPCLSTVGYDYVIKGTISQINEW